MSATAGNRDQQIRILYIIDEMEAITAGGTERQILQMISLLQRAGVSMQLCILRDTTWLTREQAGCPITFFCLRRILSLAGIRELTRLRSWIASQKFDIVQTFFVESSLVGPIVARFAGVPIVIGSRRNLNWWMTRKLAWAQRVSNLFITRLLANCEAVKKVVMRMEKAPADKVDVIYNGIDTDYFCPDPALRQRTRSALDIAADAVVFGNTATLRPKKGLEPFLQAAAEVHKFHPFTRFLLVGDGPLRPAVEGMIDALGLRGACILAGSQQDMRPFLQAMDVGVLASESEGFSNSILEYLAAGIPCIATDVGGNAEAVGAAGRLVPVHDAPALAAAMAEFANDREKREQLAAAARDRAQQFSLPKTQLALADYYRHLMATRGANRDSSARSAGGT